MPPQIRKALLTMNQVKIDIVKVEVLELLVESSADVVLAVVGVPQLGGDYTETVSESAALTQSCHFLL